MAIATTSAHVSRALEFYKKEGKYFSIGRTTPWDDEQNPKVPSISDFKIDEIVALKKVDNTYLVVQDENGSIRYRDTKWRIVTPEIRTTTTIITSSGSTTVYLASLASIVVGIKLRIGGVYEGKILTVNTGNNSVILDTAPSVNIPANSEVLGGAYVEGAKYVYIDCSLNYDQFPIVTYRQIGVQTSVAPNTQDILKSAKYSSSGIDEYTSLGNLEILDNRSPTVREVDQRENLALIIEF